MRLNYAPIIAAIFGLTLGAWLCSSCAKPPPRETKAASPSATSAPPNAGPNAQKTAPASAATRVIASAPALTVMPSPAAKLNLPGLQDRLAQLLLAYRANDSIRLAAFENEREIDLAAHTARVILEMNVDPEAHTVGAPKIETVTLPDGRTVEIQHEPAIAIRADLAQAIAATGAVYETAYQNWVQVLAPLDSLEALTKIPGVRLVRLPYASQP